MQRPAISYGLSRRGGRGEEVGRGPLGRPGVGSGQATTVGGAVHGDEGDARVPTHRLRHPRPYETSVKRGKGCKAATSERSNIYWKL